MLLYDTNINNLFQKNKQKYTINTHKQILNILDYRHLVCIIYMETGKCDNLKYILQHILTIFVNFI